MTHYVRIKSFVKWIRHYDEDVKVIANYGETAELQPNRTEFIKMSIAVSKLAKIAALGNSFLTVGSSSYLPFRVSKKSSG